MENADSFNFMSLKYTTASREVYHKNLLIIIFCDFRSLKRCINYKKAVELYFINVTLGGMPVGA